MVAELFTLANPVFASYAFYAAVVLIKMLALTPLTTIKRFANGAFANPEDQGKKKVAYDNQSVERVRRNHLNDLENIPAFLFIGLLYITIQPSPTIALWHFRVFAITRVIHTLAYQFALQPWRVIFFTFGFLVNLSMVIQVLAGTLL